MKESILHILRYFALFKHPLTADELHQFMNTTATPAELLLEIESLIEVGDIIKRGRHLQRPTDPDYSELRKNKEKKAREMISQSAGYARIISKFPFVKSIAISGSLSKLSAGADADYDFFIVTSSNRLWISRTLLHIFKKFTFITGHQNCFCMNYFVDEAHLKLPFENYYTALELKTLIPIYGTDVHDRMQQANAWSKQFLPNHSGKPLTNIDEIASNSILKRSVESIVNLISPRSINRWLMQLTDWKWRKKFASLNLSDQEYDRAIMTRIHISKNHPHDFQKRVLEAMEDTNTAERNKNVYA